MREIPMEKIFFYGGSVAFVALLVPILSKLPRNGGRNIFYHVLYLAFAIGTLLILPSDFQHDFFSPGGVMVVGILLPVYHSVLAACQLHERDKDTWLQYWIASGLLSYFTEFTDDIRNTFPVAGEYWYEIVFFVLLWLMLPFTDGATLLFDWITRPYITPIAKTIKTRFEGWMAVFLTLVNVSHMWFLWFALVTLPEDARRFVVVALGTIYPIAASTVAITADEDSEQPKFWLTYWTSYSVLFLAMDYLENFVGQIRVFYSLCAICTVYLFLPMFGGADVIFRRLLVPLTGQYENLLLHDAYLVKRNLERSIPIQQRQQVMERAANIFKAKRG